MTRRRAPQPSGDRHAEWLASLRTDPHDGTTFAGASDIGQMHPADQLDTAPFPMLHARRPAPAMFPALTPAAIPRFQPEPEPERTPVADATAAGWAHLFTIACQHPAAEHETPIPCGAVHSDENAATFRQLRQSAQAAGWHMDAFGRWACPACQMQPGFRTLYPVALWAPAVASAWEARRERVEDRALNALTAVAEQALIEDVIRASQRGRHRAVNA